jgi:hypothetical protein
MFQPTNGVGRIVGVGIVVHQVKIELRTGDGRTGWNKTGHIKLHQNRIGNLVGRPSVGVEGVESTIDVRIDVQESVSTRRDSCGVSLGAGGHSTQANQDRGCYQNVG